MRFPLSIVWLVLLGVAFAAGWYLRAPQAVQEPRAPLPELTRSPDLFAALSVAAG
tara:strand:+ start:551 stop:715 length:165 start_codon:yes stop_codon:yes gene_type:complete